MTLVSKDWNSGINSNQKKNREIIKLSIGVTAVETKIRYFSIVGDIIGQMSSKLLKKLN